MQCSPTVAAFEMLIERLERVEDGLARTERLICDQRAALDVREITLLPVTRLVGSRLSPHGREYRLCERLEDILYDSMDVLAPAQTVIDRAVRRLRELGADRVTFLMLCQIANMTEDLRPVLDLACTRPLVPVEDALAFMLHAENLVPFKTDDRDERDELNEKIHGFIHQHKSLWGTLGFVPGNPWVIGSY